MLRSSMKRISYFPAALGPYYLKVRLSMFSSKFFWKSAEVVLEEKLMVRTKNWSMDMLLN